MRKNATDLKFLRQYSDGQRDFRGVDLHGSDLRGVDLRGVDLRGANLCGANLEKANLSGGKFHRVNFSNANLCDVSFFEADLEEASLVSALLRDAILFRAKLGFANGENADFTKAVLSGSDLNCVAFRNANLRNTHLNHTNLNGAYLVHTSLHGANLQDANMCEAELRDADCGGVVLGNTVLGNVNVAPLADANPPVRHEGPSTIDFRSIVQSIYSPNLKNFLLRTGMPEVFVEFNISCAESIDGSAMKKMLRSTFISYGQPNEAFARKLYEALHRNGVTTFFFAEHAVPGQKLHDMMRDGVNKYDRVILICSKDSLGRSGVQNEIEQVLAREGRSGGETFLIPIRLDDFVFSNWTPAKPGMKQEVCDRVVADFRGADADQAKFDAGLMSLIAALKK